MKVQIVIPAGYARVKTGKVRKTDTILSPDLGDELASWQPAEEFEVGDVVGDYFMVIRKIDGYVKPEKKKCVTQGQKLRFQVATVE